MARLFAVLAGVAAGAAGAAPALAAQGVTVQVTASSPPVASPAR
jgi:hypothetical protein